jgi:hypothetical protein
MRRQRQNLPHRPGRLKFAVLCAVNVGPPARRTTRWTLPRPPASCRPGRIRPLNAAVDVARAQRKTADPAEIDVWVTVRAAPELSDFSCNLRAPIVIWKGRGHQVINEAPDASVRAPLFAGAGAVQAA